MQRVFRPSAAPLMRRETLRCWAHPRWAVFSVSLSLSLLGCDEKAKATSPAGQPAEVAPLAPGPGGTPDPEAAPAVTAGQPIHEEDAFRLELGGPKEVKLGEWAELSLVLTAKGAFKVNAEYPLKFKLSRTPGVELAQEVVDKSAGEVDAHRAELPVKIRATQAGKLDVAGRLSFSVCTDDRCLIERRDLKLSLDAS